MLQRLIGLGCSLFILIAIIVIAIIAVIIAFLFNF